MQQQMWVRRSLAASLALGAACAPFMASASADPLIEGARQCTQYFPVEEKKNSIPTHLLAAIATTESGRWHEKLGMAVPWPWTVNVEGKGYYFANKAEAIANTQKFMAQGHQSIDVGCMQVNLKQHPKAFADLNQAFDPSRNVAYSAKFLHDNYATLGDWIKATAAYHSRTPMHGQRYLVEIERSWNRIVGKVAAARVNKNALEATQVASVVPVQAVTSQPNARPVVTAKPILPTQRSRVIAVSDMSHGNNAPVDVVRPAAAVSVAAAPAQEPMIYVAQATPVPLSAAPNSVPVGNSIRRVTLDSSSASALPAGQGASAQFVFAN